MAALVALTVMAGLGVLGLIIGTRWLESHSWRGRLVAYHLRLPAGLRTDQVAAWLSVLAAETRRWPVAFELEATGKGIVYYLLMPLGLEASTLARLRSALPGLRADEVPDYLRTQPVAARVAHEFKLTDLQRPLAHDRAESAVTALLSGLYPLARGESVRVQWILQGARPLCQAVVRHPPLSNH
jgi:hypothetical protein